MKNDDCESRKATIQKEMAKYSLLAGNKLVVISSRKWLWRLADEEIPAESES